MRSLFSTPAIIAATLTIATAAAPSHADELYAVNWFGDSYSIDSNDGSGVFLASSGYANLNSMAKSAGGRYLTFSGADIIELDPLTGAGVFTSTTALLSVRGAAFHPDGTLFAIEDVGGSDSLYKVDPSSGNTAFIGDTTYNGIQGLAVASDGTMYAWDIFVGLLTIDPNTGVGTAVGGAVTGDIQTIAFDSDDNLFGARDDLFKIDTNSGAQTLIGSGAYSTVRGMEFIDVPEFTIEVTSCPTPFEMEITNATPGATIVVLYSTSSGSFTIPNAYTCAGTVLDLGGVPTIGGRALADANGDATIVFPSVPAITCSLYLQAIDLTTCETSNVVN